MKTFVINMDRSLSRWEEVQIAFPSEKLIRVSGIDGNDYASGEVSDTGKPLFDRDAYTQLVRGGVVSKKRIYNLTPCDVGCALSHMKAWNLLLLSGLDGAIILEDDVRPTEHFEGFRDFDPEDKPIVFLYAEKLKTDAGKVRHMSSTMGYYISRNAAKVALDAMTPIYLPVDIQWFSMAFEGYEFRANIQDIFVEKHSAFVKDNFWIEASNLASKSTMTRDGRKPWRE